MQLIPCVTDDDLEAWRAVRIAVEPEERCATVAELRAQETPSQLMLLARSEGNVVGSGVADRSETAGGGFALARVPVEYRRKGVGSALLRAMADHCVGLGLPRLSSRVDDEGSLAFAERFGFAEVDREVEQVRAVGDEPPPPTPPAGVDLVTLDEHPELWVACFDRFGTEVLADFALYTPLEITPEQWNTSWRGDHVFLAVHEGEVIGCAGLFRDADRPDRAENALTAVLRDWRGRGLAAHLKRRALQYAAAEGIREVYTWTQVGNKPMIALNERLGYVTRRASITISRDLPLEA